MGSVSHPPSAPKDLRAHFAAVLLLGANLCIFTTFEIYLPNRSELDSNYREVLPLLLGACLAIAILLVAVRWIIPRRFRSDFSALALVVAVLLWVQGSFLKWNYGEFTGRPIDWGAYTWQGWVDGAIWLLGLALALRYHRQIQKNALFVALAFIVIQSGFMIARAVTGRADVGQARFGGTTSTSERLENVVPSDLCRLSASRNIFHVVLDAFQTDIFMELVEEEDLRDKLDGFVLYKENLSVGGRTVLCIPAIFSGQTYDGTVSESQYFRNAMNGSFHNVLARKNYVVNLIPQLTMEGTRYTHYFPSPATYAVARHIRLLRTSTYLIDVSLFRDLPHILKRLVYNDQNWRLSSLVTEPPQHASFSQKAFFRDYTARLEVGDTRPAYHFIHLSPPHPPYVTLPDGTYAGRTLPNTRDNCKTESRYMFRLFIEFVAQLRKLGVLDNATILVQGDHGSGFTPVLTGARPNDRAGRFAALLLLKPPGAHGPMKVSSAPTTIADIPTTLLDLVGVPNSYDGESVVRLDPDASRQREVVVVENRSARTPTLRRWIIEGSVYDSTAWQPEDKRLIERPISDYKWGQKVNFGIAGRGEAYLTSGWSTTSATVHWNDGPSAVMSFRIPPPSADVQMRFIFYPHIIPGKVNHQRIRLSVNDELLGNVNCTARTAQALTIVVPGRLLQGGEMVVVFEFPDAVSSAEIGVGTDPRARAMGLQAFETTLVGKR